MKEYNFECYMYNDDRTIDGWEIEFISVFANSKKEAKEALKQVPLFDCIILFNYCVYVDVNTYDDHIINKGYIFTTN